MSRNLNRNPAVSRREHQSKPLRCLGIKLHNARVEGGLMTDGTMVWQFRRLLPNRTIYAERIRLSKQMIFAMCHIAELLNIDSLGNTDRTHKARLAEAGKKEKSKKQK